MIAVDAMPARGKLQVLDFVTAGDVISSSASRSIAKVSMRAITETVLVAVRPPNDEDEAAASEYWDFLLSRWARQLERLNLHQLMIGRLETEARVASFLLSLSMRGARTPMRLPDMTVALPMSRVDIANYLVINCDTLSRTMMKLCDARLIERLGRHSVRILDFEGLKRRSPIASMLSGVFLKADEAIDVGRPPAAAMREPAVAKELRPRLSAADPRGSSRNAV